MPSSTSLYSSTPGNANVASQNFTTLYSGSGAINPQQAYGNANVVSLLAVGTDGGNTIGNISATGNVTAAYFIGNVNAANIVGNIAAAGSNTQVQFNNAGVLGADSDFTFNSATSALAVTGNITGGNVVTSGTGLLVGNVFSEVAAGANVAVLTARMATDDTFRILVGGIVDDGFVEIATADAGTEPIYVRQYTGGISGPFTTLLRSLTLLDAAGNTLIPGNTSVVGNVAAAYFIGNGSALTSITGANVTGNVANATFATTAGSAGTANLAQFVTANAQANITSVGILTALSASGNITGGNVNSLANISAVGNITASYFIGNGSQLTGVATAAAGANTQVQFNDAGVTNGTAGFTFDKTSNAVAVVGNITGANINGNGLGLSSLTGANVTGTVANATYALNANSATYATDAVQANYANIANSVAGANVTGTVANAAYATTAGSATTAITANTVTDAAQANITSVGILTSVSVSGNITSGNINNNGTITSIGNITAPNFIGNIAGNVVAGGANTQVQFNDNNLLNGTAGLTFDKTSNALAVTGNVSGGNVIVPVNGRYYGDFTTGTASGRTAFQTTATGNSAATSLTAIPGPNHTTSNTAFSSQLNLFANGADVGNSAFGRIQMFGNRMNFEATAAGTGLVGNMRFTAGAAQMVFLNTGNVGIGNANPEHNLSVQATLFVGTDLSVQGNISPVSSISASGNITGGNLITPGLITATGNITGANLVATANLTSTQQTIVGTANNGSTGNIVMSGKNIATDMLFAPDGGDATTAQRGRVLIGTGFNGNNAHSAVQHRLYVNDSVTRSATANNAMQLFASVTQVSLTGNVTGGAFRQQAVAARLRIGGGAAANTINLTLTAGSTFSVAALQPNLDVGNASPYFLGNTSVSQAVLNGGFITPAAGSTVTHAYGMIPAVNNGGTVTNYMGFASQLNLMSGTVTGNVYGMYHGSNTTLSTTGISVNNVARSAPGYYAFYNADDVAQIKLGSLRSYNEYQHIANTSGTVNIDKNNAQVQFISPTANVTIGDYQNFVSVANDGTNNDLQTDTVTLIIQQGATPYTVTMPTGNASIKYVGNATTVGTTANSVTMVSITAMKSLGNATGSTLYLTTVSPEFV